MLKLLFINKNFINFVLDLIPRFLYLRDDRIYNFINDRKEKSQLKLKMMELRCVFIMNIQKKQNFQLNAIKTILQNTLKTIYYFNMILIKKN